MGLRIPKVIFDKLKPLEVNKAEKTSVGVNRHRDNRYQGSD